MKFEHSANKKKKQIMTERPNGSFSRGNVYYHEIKWYYGRNKGFGISSLAQAFISSLTLSRYQIFLSICFLTCKLYIAVPPDRTIVRSKQHHSTVPAKPLAFKKRRLRLLRVRGSDQLPQETRDCLAYLLVHRCVRHGSR